MRKFSPRALVPSTDSRGGNAFDKMHAKGRDDSDIILENLIRQRESDRGCVIFSAALSEEWLETIMRAYCRNDPASVKNTVDPLFHGFAPLSTFAAKIQVCYALGLIPRKMRMELELLRKLRNDFAHEKGAVSFQSPQYRSRLLAVLSATEWRKMTNARKSNSSKNDGKPLPPRRRRKFSDRLAFCMAISKILAGLKVCAIHAEFHRDHGLLRDIEKREEALGT